MRECQIENISVQKEFGFCNVHTLANSLRDYDFIELLSNDEFKSGDNDSFKRMLRLCGYSKYYMKDVCKIDPYYGGLENEMLYKIIIDQNESTKCDSIEFKMIPYYLTVQLKEPHFHSVCVMNIEGRLFYSDPYRNRFIEIESHKDFDSLFLRVTEVARLALSLKDRKAWAVFDADAMGLTEYIYNTIKING